MSQVPRLNESGHRHDWDLVAYPDGHVHARCECGHERRLLTGDLCRGRAGPLRVWQTPLHWNPSLRADSSG